MLDKPEEQPKVDATKSPETIDQTKATGQTDSKLPTGHAQDSSVHRGESTHYSDQGYQVEQRETERGEQSSSHTEQEKLSSSGQPGQISRRTALIGGGAAVAAGIGAGLVGGYFTGVNRGYQRAEQKLDVIQTEYSFRGKHQSGIITPQQQQMMMAAYDMTSNRRQDLIQLLKDWSLAAERMMGGHLVNEMRASKLAPPDDTGETMGLGPSALTITIGFGETLFRTAEGKDRYGIAHALPAPLKGGIPRMAAEYLVPEHCYGDLVVQACADDPMVAMHAIHNLTRIAFGTARVRWSQLGYGRTASTSTGQKTPRNLFGFKDGTSNIKQEDGETELNKHLWIQPGDDGGKYFAGGSYLCTRKIKQMMEVWDELVLSEQETIIGRDKIEGAPLSGGHEFSTPDFKKKDADGNLLIAPDSHLHLVHPSNNHGWRMLRRGYNYMEGTDAYGRLQGGLFFIAYVRDPKTNFIPVLQRMSKDQLTEYLQHVATGMWLIPPGVKDREEFLAEKLFT